ncbi:hypothetical protein PUW24_14085 [Paenibacillus urinalis]|uniref:Uncharacterized protein n=1 Tax=Paenibacillus urinalis TaxID=521520 RepID=A0ABY7XFL8_9BACL|nr:hypothetical protein [Paenibacillus urinalis]WDH95356.1 hypothetical protein PUW24_14085 [Paenibacillus urinalis]WDI03551.1 hypothetical protein PUW25_06210 [Paenibacillus urinalis]
MTEQVKLSQYSAILLENARHYGVTDEDVLTAIRTGDLAAFSHAEREHYTYEAFLSYAKEHGEELERAVQEGYRITFNTNNGLKNWIAITFDLKPGIDFNAAEGLVDGLILTGEQAEKLRKSLASNWHIADEIDTADGHKELTLRLRGM